MSWMDKLDQLYSRLTVFSFLNCTLHLERCLTYWSKNRDRVEWLQTRAVARMKALPYLLALKCQS